MSYNIRIHISTFHSQLSLSKVNSPLYHKISTVIFHCLCLIRLVFSYKVGYGTNKLSYNFSYPYFHSPLSKVNSPLSKTPFTRDFTA